MIDYDFSTLNDKEFEDLSVDLISKDKNKRFERFKVGKDGGIDGRFYHGDGTQEVIQCKHYLKTGFIGLISSLKKKNDKDINEIEKVKKLNPIKYIFVTSLPLSAENKMTIKELFDPYIKNDSDIYGQEDLNQILGNHPDIEKRHYKLWLSSTVVLDRIVNNAIEGRSEFLLEDIKEKSKYYALTENHQKAIDKLEESHIIIIAGEPGIGKTTLAENLALWYIEKGFKFYNIEDPINEAESIYKRDEKQIFYFDDFLGANYLNAIENKKDSHIVKFMDRIKKDKTKRFILTSRTNIFNQGLALSDTFRSNNIENEEFIIKIESLKDIDKAHILYNHIWHSNLDEKFIDEIYVDKRYKAIIKHKNFNPRLIAFITDTQKIQKEQIEAKDYWNYIVEKLANPKDIWKNTFDTQSDDFTRAIVMLTVFNGNKIEEDKLRDSYYKYIELAGLTSSSHTSKEFDSIIEEVVKYFLNRNQTYSKKIEYSLFNPSIADFVLNRYKTNQRELILLYSSLDTDDSFRSLMDLAKNKIIDKNSYNIILNNLLKNFGESFTLLVCTLKNINLINDEKNFVSKIKIFVDKYNEYDFGLNFSDFLEMLVYLTKTINYQFDLKILLSKNMFYSFHDLPNILSIYKNLDLNEIKILENLKNKFEDDVIDILEMNAYQMDISKIDNEYLKNGEKLKELLFLLLNSILEDIDDTLIHFDKQHIVNSIDIEDLFKEIERTHKNIEKTQRNTDEYQNKIEEDIHIDDLFER